MTIKAKTIGNGQGQFYDRDGVLWDKPMVLFYEWKDAELLELYSKRPAWLEKSLPGITVIKLTIIVK